MEFYRWRESGPAPNGAETEARGMTAAPARILLFIMVLGLAACAENDDRYVASKPARQAIVLETISATDWTNAQELTLNLKEFSFSPELPVLKVGTPYELRLVNDGAVAHSFTAGEFLSSIAAQRLTMPDAEASMPFLESISVEPREETILVFVPTSPGRYEFFCDRLFHKKFGMTGSVTVQ